MKESKTVKKIGILLAVMLLVFGLAGCSAQQSPENTPSINATGIGKITTEPDTVEMSFTVATEGKDKNVQGDNAAKTQKVIDALVAAGLANDEMETKNVNFYPLRRWDKDKGDVLTGYRAENTLVIKTKKTTLSGALVDAAVQNEAEMAGSLSFSLSDEGKQNLLGQAIEKAVADARTQAEATAKAAGVQLAKIRRIDVLKNSQPGPILFDTRLKMAEAAVDTPILPADAEFSVTVNVSYEIK